MILATGLLNPSIDITINNLKQMVNFIKNNNMEYTLLIVLWKNDKNARELQRQLINIKFENTIFHIIKDRVKLKQPYGNWARMFNCQKWIYKNIDFKNYDYCFRFRVDMFLINFELPIELNDEYYYTHGNEIPYPDDNFGLAHKNTYWNIWNRDAHAPGNSPYVHLTGESTDLKDISQFLYDVHDKYYLSNKYCYVLIKDQGEHLRSTGMRLISHLTGSGHPLNTKFEIKDTIIDFQNRHMIT